MVSIGSKALPLRKHKTSNLSEGSFMAGEDNPYDKRGVKRSMNRRAMRKPPSFDGSHSSEKFSGGKTDKSTNTQKSSEQPQTLLVRKRVDPETEKYFSEIANAIEGTGVDLEERSVICGNALEETQGKEVELATDYIISHTLQTLLEGCSVDYLCSFLQSGAKDFPCIAIDRSGSHVAETALKSLAMHGQDSASQSLIEETLTLICRAIVVNPVDVMCNCHGSHVLRSLLCLCKGVTLDSSEFHVTNSSSVLAARLNLISPSLDENDSHNMQQGFPDLLKFLVSEMLNRARKDIRTMQVNHYSSLVLQTALKLLVGHEQELLRIIPILLGCNMENVVEGNLVEVSAVRNLLNLMEETAYSHLMEVILEVAPEILYNELFTKVFRNSLFEMSSHHCGNFVVQALVSYARSQDHMGLIWEELGTKFVDLLQMGRSGVIASLVAASQRLHSHEHKCCQALANAVCSADEPPTCIIPRLLFLDSYFWCEDKSNWSWPKGAKMHVMGSLILQVVFKLPSEFIQPFITSLTSMEADHVLEASKASGGARVIEAFLSSNASGKQKRKVVVKLQGHFGELAMHPSGSFTVEKCFNTSNISMKEAIVSELVAVQTELSKTRQGPLLSRKLDVDGFARRPDQWKLRQASKQSTFKEYYDEFGSKEIKSSNADSFLSETHRLSQPEKMKDMRREIDARLASATTPFLASKSSISGHKRSREMTVHQGEKFTEHVVDDDALRNKNKKHKKKKTKGGDENAEAFTSTDKKEKKRHKKGGL